MRAEAAVVVVFAAVALGGCLGTTNLPTGSTDELVFTPCEHPYPCGDGSEWPVGLEGPFDILDAEVLEAEGADGVVLRGALWKPDVPEGTALPVVLVGIPYHGECFSIPPAAPLFCYPDPEDRALFDLYDAFGLEYRRLVEEGYALAFFNVRGTGLSGGCFEMYGPGEQADMARLVEWAAGQPWSNGRVAMYGLSYFGTTPWEAAVQAPDGLKTIVPVGFVADPYSLMFTPQGAPSLEWSLAAPAFAGTLGVAPPLGEDIQDLAAAWAPAAPERLCPEVVEAMTETTTSTHTDLRDEDFWTDRNLIRRYGDVTAAVFMAHSSQEWLTHQVDMAWGALSGATPKRLLLGTWGHVDGYDAYLATHPDADDWGDLVVAWMDYWLKGLGTPADVGVGVVDFQDTRRAWHRTTAWPPAPTRDEVLYLTAAGAVAPEEGAGTFAFRAVPTDVPRLCPGDDPRTAHLLLSEPVQEPVHIAGNPFTYLTLESDLPGGVVALDLVDVRPEFQPAFDCQHPEEHLGYIAGGAADLRFHRGNFRGEDFPTGTPTAVRIDASATSWVLEPGHRLGVVVSGDAAALRREGAFGTRDPVSGVTYTRFGQPYHPEITVHPGSHVVLPLVEGTFGGEAPTLDYPPRPFVPGGS